MSGNFSWYKREPKKFIRGVVGMGADLIGCYSVVLDLIYEDEGSCPNDAAWIGGILGESSRKTGALIRALIERGKLSLNADGRLVNAKASEVIESRTRGPRNQDESGGNSARTQHEVDQNRGDKSKAPAPAPKKNKGLARTDKTRRDKNRIEKKETGANAPVVPDGTPEDGGASLPVVVGEVVTDLRQAVDSYNAAAARCPDKPNGYGNAGWASARWPLTSQREKSIRTRMGEVGLDGWKAAMDRAAASDFLSGRARRSPGRERWGVDIGWLAKAENFTKLLEGKYDNDRGRASGPVGQESARAGLMDFLREEEPEHG